MLPDDFPNWVSRASHLASPKTLPKHTYETLPCSAVVASERHKQANGDGIPIAIAPKAPRSPVILSSPPSVCLISKQTIPCGIVQVMKLGIVKVTTTIIYWTL